MLPLEHLPTLADIRETHGAIAHMIHRTPVLTCQSIDELTGVSLFFKCENFQKIGAFKMRGAASASLRLSDADKQKGLTTHSSGNHAQAVALSAKLLGVSAYIVMPENAPAIKKAGVKSYGGQIITCESTIEAREQTLKQVQSETGATFIHPYDDYNVIAGQATAVKELIEDTHGLDIVVSPIGGGGLMSGTALCTKYLNPNIKVFGAEPELVNDAYRSFKSGTFQSNTRIDTIADGLRTNLGDKTFPIIQSHVDDIVTATEEGIISAMRLIWERMKIIIEPSCAVPLAAIIENPAPFAGKKVGVLLTGGNVDLGALPFR